MRSPGETMTWLRSLLANPAISAFVVENHRPWRIAARDFSVTPYSDIRYTSPAKHTRCNETDDARARDSISGRQGSLTPALAPARPRRLYYDVYGLIRDILEMSRVHARRVAGKYGERRCSKGAGGAEETGETRGETRRGGCEDRRAVARGE